VTRLAFLIALLLAWASVAVVAAFTGGTVRSGGSVMVVNNGTGALLALAPDTGSANDTGIAYWSGNVIVLDFRKGADPAVTYGFQPGSTYEFRELVTVTNNAGRTVSVSATLLDDGDSTPADLLHVKDQDGNTLAGAGAGPVTVADGGLLRLSFKWSGTSPDGTVTPIRLTISAQ
jgi:hypothetical protein